MRGETSMTNEILGCAWCGLLSRDEVVIAFHRCPERDQAIKKREKATA